ncbi:hypothetical protein CJI59_36455 [Streptomyces sp. Alain-F2R5]|nr:hypothetical protein CJI59_36455 [Streptomyces sp. Alain-F2R5]
MLQPSSGHIGPPLSRAPILEDIEDHGPAQAVWIPLTGGKHRPWTDLWLSPTPFVGRYERPASSPPRSLTAPRRWPPPRCSVCS